MGIREKLDELTEDDFRYNVGNNIYFIIKKSNFTQADVCRATGISEVSLSRYVNNERIPTLFNMYKISQFLGVLIDEIVKGK